MPAKCLNSMTAFFTLWAIDKSLIDISKACHKDTCKMPAKCLQMPAKCLNPMTAFFTFWAKDQSLIYISKVCHKNACKMP
jgi:hypothetical protein